MLSKNKVRVDSLFNTKLHQGIQALALKYGFFRAFLVAQ